MHSLRITRLAVIALVAVAITAPPAEARRRQAVRKTAAAGSITIAELRGVVLDSVTGNPVVQARVSGGGDADTTDAAGKFRLRNIQGYQGKLVIEVVRSGYAAGSLTLTGAPTGDVTIRVQPGPTVRVQKTDGTTFDLDFDSLLFGYAIPFAGYTSAEFEEFCKPDGSVVQIHRDQFKRITGPAVAVTQNPCCPAGETLKVTAELKSGETSDLFFTDACEGYPNIDLIGRERVNGKYQYIRFTQIASITFP